ncbi:hypothetical protein Q5P01_025996 [Channa striata]|uniref:Uncharacterized protein n=1 Tax=Channa striata TaxID=64152 RepID=A0AA88IMY5_CHASR|nr:hypothetical protein Q5P01_025996 [Channa striata]
MDLRTVLIITALLLTAADAFSTNTTSTPARNQTDNCTCKSPGDGPTTGLSPYTPPPSNQPLPVLGFLTIKWTSLCKGEVILHRPSNFSHVCYESKTQTEALLRRLCQEKKGCKGPDRPWAKSESESSGSAITESGAEPTTSCYTLRVQCKVEVIPDFEGQLQTYKVITALLCTVLALIVLIRFTKPTFQALQRRLSNKRQNRWIGPTQSHSVSYHRGKNVKNNEGEKRLSYPGLERLTVSDSREPSSNRNSGYNF